jgi:hypothetical protein
VAIIGVALDTPAEGTFDAQGRYSETAYYKVQSDDKTDGPYVVLTAPGLPQPGNFVGSGASIAFFQTATANRETRTASGGAVWKVTVQYGPYDWTTATPLGDPSNFPIRFRWEIEEFERPSIKDVTGAAILNSAGQPFGEPVMVEDSRRVLLVVRNEPVAGFDPILADSFANTLNAAVWNGAAAKTVKAKPIVTGDQQYSQELQGWFFPVTYRFHYRAEGWQAELVDQGFAELVAGSPPKLRVLKDLEGQDLKEPALLNGSGVRLTNPSPGNEVYLAYDVYRTADFSLLNLDLSLALGV